MRSYDLHLHTFLSACASPTEAFPAAYIRSAEDAGLAVIGFTDHAWDKSVGACSNWYQNQGYERLAARKDLVARAKPGLPVLLGAEGELAAGLLGLGEDALSLVDYVIVPHSHTHMQGFVLPAGSETPEKHADYLLRSFETLCTHKLAKQIFGVAHPMVPIGANLEQAQDIYAHLDIKDFAESFAAAAENKLYLEVNMASMQRFGLDYLRGSFLEEFYRAAKTAGCGFFMGSDKHRAIPYGEKDDFFTIMDYATVLGLEESDFSAALDTALNLEGKK